MLFTPRIDKHHESTIGLFGDPVFGIGFGE
jgi:hypothetical protein